MLKKPIPTVCNTCVLFTNVNFMAEYLFLATQHRIGN